MRLALVPTHVGEKSPPSLEEFAASFFLASVDFNKVQSALAVRDMMRLLYESARQVSVHTRERVASVCWWEVHLLSVTLPFVDAVVHVVSPLMPPGVSVQRARRLELSPAPLVTARVRDCASAMSTHTL